MDVDGVAVTVTFAVPETWRSFASAPVLNSTRPFEVSVGRAAQLFEDWPEESVNDAVPVPAVVPSVPTPGVLPDAGRRVTALPAGHAAWSTQTSGARSTLAPGVFSIPLSMLSR